MGIIRVVRDPHNLSESRKNSVLACAARAGYENALYQDVHRTSHAYWQAGGGAAHFAIDQIVKNTIAQGKVLAEKEVDQTVEQARKHIWMVLSGIIPPRGHSERGRLLSIMWTSEEERLRKSDAEMEKLIKQRRGKYLNQITPAIRAIALRCTIPSPFRRTLTEVSFSNKLTLISPRDPNILIPVWGSIDLLDQHSSGGMILTDWKSGNFSAYLQKDLEGNDQMLIYWRAVMELFGVEPMIAYFVSLSIFARDVERYGAKALELDQYRAQARIRFEEHFPELLRVYDDIWTMLTFVSHPAETKEEKKEQLDWMPSSAVGQRVGLQNHVSQGRLIPSIGKHCGMCPAKLQCRQDNPQDWEAYQARQRLGNVVEPLDIIPENWLEPFQVPDEVLLRNEDGEALETDEQLSFFATKEKQRSPLRRHNLKAKDWKEFGFFTPKELVALTRRMHEIIPVENGVVCPCKNTERIPTFLLQAAGQFFVEREEHKQAQEEQGKKRSGNGDDKVKDLYDSDTVREILSHCPVQDCPFAKKISLAS